ncbi:hypothetical protein Dimus_019980 [Dionaea muscipula]
MLLLANGSARKPSRFLLAACTSMPAASKADCRPLIGRIHATCIQKMEEDDIFDEFEKGGEEVGVMDSTDTRTVDVDGNVGQSSGQSTTEINANNVKEKRKRKEVSHV